MSGPPGTITGAELRDALVRARDSGRTVGEELGLASKPGAARAWSSAVTRTCRAGHRHPSKLEARVCDALTPQAARAGVLLFHQVRIPLLAIAPRDTGRPFYCTVDFALVKGGQILRLLDAKGRVSREWPRGKAAVHATCGVPIEEITADVAKVMEREELLARSTSEVSSRKEGGRGHAIRDLMNEGRVFDGPAPS